MRLLYAEALKIRTAPRTLLGIVLGLAALVVVGSGATASDADSSPISAELVVWDVISVATIATVFTLILGILIVTWEYRHGTITQTYLASPRRERVIGAKLALSFGLGAVLALLSIALAIAVALYWVSIELHQEQTELIGRMVLGAALWGVAGAGLGAILQSQVGAIVTAFVWFLVAEPLLTFQFEGFSDYLPGNALDRLINTGEPDFGPGDENPYSLWVAAVLAGAYAAGLAALGAVSAVRRDVT